MISKITILHQFYKCWFQLQLTVKINVLKFRREEKVINIKKNQVTSLLKTKKEINSVDSNEASTKSHSLEDESQSSEGKETGNQKRSGPMKWKIPESGATSPVPLPDVRDSVLAQNTEFPA